MKPVLSCKHPIGFWLQVDGSAGGQTAAAGVVLAAATRKTLPLWVPTVCSP